MFQFNTDSKITHETKGESNLSTLSEDATNELNIPESLNKNLMLIHVSYKINFISAIDTSSSTCDIDIKLFLLWTDPKVIGKKAGQINLKEENLTDPDIIITNERNLDVLSKEIKIVDSGIGKIKCTTHYRGSVFISDMSLKLFPFDNHNLQFGLRPRLLDKKSIILKADNPKMCILDSFVMHEWHIAGHFLKGYNTDPKLSTSSKSYSSININILAKRHYGWYINNVYITSSLILLFGFFTFIMDMVILLFSYIIIIYHRNLPSYFIFILKITLYLK